MKKKTRVRRQPFRRAACAKRGVWAGKIALALVTGRVRRNASGGPAPLWWWSRRRLFGGAGLCGGWTVPLWTPRFLVGGCLEIQMEGGS
jgi:hypothetical protein